MKYDKKYVEKEIEQLRIAFERAVSATDFYAAVANARYVSNNLESLIREKFEG